MNDEIINPMNVTQDLLMDYFNKAYFETSLDDKGSLFIKDKFRIFIDIHKKKTNITFSVNFNIQDNASLSDIVEYTVNVNKALLQIKAVPLTKVITIEYDLWIEGGAIVKNIIAAYRSFVSQVSAAISHDKKRVLL